ncbi:MAG: gamma-glutamylaminecyclotransferase [Hydrogenophaga sp.]|jgi:gamma-glutamylaminecyclotransferase
MPTLIFVYGTLKEGFPNFSLNPGRRIPGSFRTRQPFPFYVVQLPVEERAPWLVNSPGQGVQVSGQVFEVDDAMLQSMDTFEEVGALSGYVRLALELESAQLDAGVLRADAYMKEQHQLVECLLIEGPFADYTAELAVGYRLELP